MKYRKVISIDIETFSGANLPDTGVYKYVQDPDFTILLIGYGETEEGIKCVDLTKKPFPEGLLKDILDPTVLKTAYNAAFEITCLSEYLGIELDPVDWECTQVRAVVAGYPFRLGVAGRAAGVDAEKDKTGTDLIKLFSMFKPKLVDGLKSRNMPEQFPEKWQQFIDYCKMDVKVEMQLRKKVIKFKMTDFERDMWVLDQEINSRGIQIDWLLVAGAIHINEEYSVHLMQRAKELTQLSNPNSGPQLMGWLKTQGIQIASVAKEVIASLLKRDLPDRVRTVLELRQMLSKASISKYGAMNDMLCKDFRIRGILQYYGASRTGRWAGRGVQPQNLTKPEITSIDLARGLVKNFDIETIEAIYGDVLSILSQLIRTAIIPKCGHKFIVSDFAAIEARVIAWLCGERWRLEVFRTHGLIYEASAAQMFRVPIDSIVRKVDGKKIEGENYRLRAQGKVAELALGFGGGRNALASMDKGGAIPEEEYQDIVDAWREASPAICGTWRSVNKAARMALESPGSVQTVNDKVKFCLKDGSLRCMLPSGRQLSYVDAQIVDAAHFTAIDALQECDKFAKGAIETFDENGVPTYYLAVKFLNVLVYSVRKNYDKYPIALVDYGEGKKTEKVFAWVGTAADKQKKNQIAYRSTSNIGTWGWEVTYGGKMFENIVQAIARDCVAVALMRQKAEGFQLVMHVHDETVAEEPIGGRNAEDVTRLLEMPMPWAPTLPLKAESFETMYYTK